MIRRFSKRRSKHALNSVHKSCKLLACVAGACKKERTRERETNPVRHTYIQTYTHTYIPYCLSTVIWVKNCRSKRGIKQCLGGLKCSHKAKKNKKRHRVQRSFVWINELLIELRYSFNVQIMCGVRLNLKKYYLHDKLPNESIILMLSTAKMLK